MPAGNSSFELLNQIVFLCTTSSLAPLLYLSVESKGLKGCTASFLFPCLALSLASFHYKLILSKLGCSDIGEAFISVTSINIARNLLHLSVLLLNYTFTLKCLNFGGYFSLKRSMSLLLFPFFMTVSFLLYRLLYNNRHIFLCLSSMAFGAFILLTIVILLFRKPFELSNSFPILMWQVMPNIMVSQLVVFNRGNIFLTVILLLLHGSASMLFTVVAAQLLSSSFDALSYSWFTSLICLALLLMAYQVTDLQKEFSSYCSLPKSGPLSLTNFLLLNVFTAITLFSISRIEGSFVALFSILLFSLISVLLPLLFVLSYPHIFARRDRFFSIGVAVIYFTIALYIYEELFSAK